MATPHASMPRRVLLTGGDGFVGRHFAPALASWLGDSGTVTLAVRQPRPTSPYPQVALELEDPSSVAAAVREVAPDLVVHLAAQSSVGQAPRLAAATWAVNLGGSLVLARAVSAYAPTSTFFFASSAEVYGATFNREIASEASPLWPLTPYARAKAAAEGMFADVLPATTRLIVARPCNHSGVGQDERFVIPSFAQQIARCERAGGPGVIAVGNLEAERDFLDVGDVVAAYLALLAHASQLPSRGTFNVASGRTIKVGEILAKLRSMSRTGTTVQPDPQRTRPSDIPVAALDGTALRRATGWRPARSLDATLANVLAEQRELAGK